MIMSTTRRTTRLDCGHGCVIRRASEARASAPIRALVAAIVAFACATSIVSYAFAEESGGGGGHSFEGPNVGIIFYGPTPALDSNANQVNEVGVTAYNVFDAAAYVLGYSYGEVRSWSADIRAKLSNSETGGRFWQFAQTFTHTNNIDGVQWFVANVLYGEDLCWRSLYSDEVYRNALTDCQTIINGGDIGGGGGNGGQFTGFPATVTLTKGTKSKGFVDVKSFWFNSSSGRVYVDNLTDIVETITAQSSLVVPEGNYKIYCVSQMTNDPSSSATGFFYVYLIPDGCAEIKDVDGKTGLYITQECTYYQVYNSRNVSTIILDGNTLRVPLQATSLQTFSRASGFRVEGESSNDERACFFSGASDTVVVPPTNWPEQPDAPTPPELPEPGTNPTVTPTPWAPVISPTFDFDLNITTEPTSNDLIDWVKKIYYELRNFHSDAQDWFEEVGKGIDSLVDAIDDAQEQIYGELQSIDETLRDEGQKLRDYMYQMFHWLKDQLDFQNNSFDDNNIVYWLKRIWSKLGNGDINLRPTDPTNDPDDWWDWLVKAVQNFLIGLAATSTELISEIADLASQVMHEFPFSIPWDIAAVLAALSTAPVTPVFTITIPAISGWWNAFDIVIDMSPFNGAAETIRLMEKLLFTGLLIWKSKELLDFMDVTRWFD